MENTTVKTARPKWLRHPDAGRAAPFFRKEFTLDKVPAQAKLRICGLGYYELYINGKRVGDHVLDPAPAQYDKHYCYVDYDVKEYLKEGRNAVGVILGNGWYDCATVTVWQMETALWRAPARFFLELRNETEILCISDIDWKTSTGPITFNDLRNGEFYDARLELDGWAAEGFDDSAWLEVKTANPPGGLPMPQIQPPCRITKVYPSVSCKEFSPERKIWDCGYNITGWARIRVKGEAGAKVVMHHAEDIYPESGELNLTAIGGYVKTGEFQTDSYILKGGEEEIWQPRFTYHGFRYTETITEGKVEILAVEACEIHTDFRKTGSFESSSDMLNKLQFCTVQSFKGNFTGIPTDCPHREKNSWTGDAVLAADTGFCNFDMAAAYTQWLRSFADAQRPSGQLVGVVLTTGFSYLADWSGPAWESAFLMIPWKQYLYTGDISILKEHYEGFRRYLDYLADMAHNGLLNFGLGDWVPPGGIVETPVALTSTAYYYADLIITAKTARLLGRNTEAEEYFAEAEYVKEAFRREFLHEDGTVGIGDACSYSCAIGLGLLNEDEIPGCTERLAEIFRGNGAKAAFGILGAKYTLRALAEQGYGNLVYDIMTQEEFPGWGGWVKQGATTLWETWEGNASKNHIMFGDISACMYQYFAGIMPMEEYPGFRRFRVKPVFPDQLDFVTMTYDSPQGTIAAEWKREGDRIAYKLTVPEGSEALLCLPGRETELVKSGTKEISI